MGEINWTAEAEIWLQDIFSYIAHDNAEVAGRVVTEIYDKVQILKDFPEMGYPYRSEAEGDIRILLYGHYRIAYLIKKDLDQIDILGVFHGALDDIDQYLM